MRNVVASLGTALTPEQAKLLNRFARKVVVNYDGDRAGINAAKRAIEVLLPEDFEVKVLVLPEGADPDEFVRAHGADEYNQRRGESAPHMQFVLEQAMRDRNLHNPPEKSEAVAEVLPFVRAVRNTIQKREYFDIMMDSLRVDDLSLRQELWKTVSARDAKALGDDEMKKACAPLRSPTEAENSCSNCSAEAALRLLLPQLHKRLRWLATAHFGAAARGGAGSASFLSGRWSATRMPSCPTVFTSRARGGRPLPFLAKAEGAITLLLMSYERRIKELAAEIRARAAPATSPCTAHS